MNKTLKLSLFKIIFIFVVILLDLLSKQLFYNSNAILIPGLLGFRQSLLNTGGAWSILNNSMWLLILLSCVFVVGVSVFDFFFKSQSKVYSLAFSFIVGGTIGNLIDRIFLGGVRDFIFFDFWVTYPTFNIADSFLLVGMILLFVYIIFIYKPKEKTKVS